MDSGSPSPMDNSSTMTMEDRPSDPMNLLSPSSIMDYESISSRDVEVFTPPSDDNDNTQQVSVTSGPWRVAHTLKNHDNIKLESPTAPALIFWYISLNRLLISGKDICGSHIALVATASSWVFVPPTNQVPTNSRSTTSPQTRGRVPRVTIRPRSQVSMNASISPGNLRAPTPESGISPPTARETGDLNRFPSEQVSRPHPHQSSMRSMAGSILPGSPSTPMETAHTTSGSLTPQMVLTGLHLSVNK
jgi:hypothetical protein